MTGFGTATVQLPSKKITVDIKSLNSKQLDLNCRIPSSLRTAELAMRNIAAAKLERGKVDVNVTVENTAGQCSAHFDANAIAAYKAHIEEVATKTGLPLPDDWYSVIMRMPDVLVVSEGNEADADETRDALLDATSRAVDLLMDYRRAEGLKLEDFFTVRIDRLRKLLADIEPFERERVEHIKSRLVDGLSKIPVAEYDKGRLEQEMIFYIEKLDVNEEKQRLGQHIAYFMETMNDPHPGQGKKLGFIAQEMGREINTLGSKSNHAEMQRIVVRMKDELEQIKEQVLNVM